MNIVKGISGSFGCGLNGHFSDGYKYYYPNMNDLPGEQDDKRVDYLFKYINRR